MRLIDGDKMNLLLGISDRDIYAKRMLDHMDTVDAVPVVRCKDCQNLRQSGTGWRCCEYGGTITPQDYCSRAERITNTAEPQRVPWEAD